MEQHTFTWYKDNIVEGSSENANRTQWKNKIQ